MKAMAAARCKIQNIQAKAAGLRRVKDLLYLPSAHRKLFQTTFSFRTQPDDDDDGDDDDDDDDEGVGL